jgi:hypothetical protein
MSTGAMGSRYLAGYRSINEKKVGKHNQKLGGG